MEWITDFLAWSFWISFCMDFFCLRSFIWYPFRVTHHHCFHSLALHIQRSCSYHIPSVFSRIRWVWAFCFVWQLVLFLADVIYKEGVELLLLFSLKCPPAGYNQLWELVHHVGCCLDDSKAILSIKLFSFSLPFLQTQIKKNPEAGFV